jgi:ComF family protein
MDNIKPPWQWAHWRKQILESLPCSCKVCDRPGTALLYSQCRKDCQYHEDICGQCGERLPENYLLAHSFTANHCGSCITRPPPFQRTVFAHRYNGPVAELIQQLKFAEALILSRLPAEMIIDRIRTHHSDLSLPDALIPVPLHPQRLKQRGFNQSLEIVRHIGKELGIPVYKHLLIRTRATPKQSGLNRKARERNIKGAFKLEPKNRRVPELADKHIAIVDDVITTGSTVREATKVLKRGRRVKITVIAVAKTQRWFIYK